MSWRKLLLVVGVVALGACAPELEAPEVPEAIQQHIESGGCPDELGRADSLTGGSCLGCHEGITDVVADEGDAAARLAGTPAACRPCHVHHDPFEP